MKRITLAILILMLLLGCAPHFKKERELSKPLVGLAISRIQQNDLKGAIIDLRKAEMANPSDPEVYYYLAYVYKMTEKYDKALENIDKAIEHADNLGFEHPGLKSEGYNLKGIILSGQGKNEEAIEAFKKALKDELYKTPEFVYNNLGSLYLQMKNTPLALENAQKALDANSHYAPAWELLARIYVLQGKANDAIDALRHAVLEFPGYTEAHWELAQLYIQTGNKIEGKKQLLEVMKLDPDGPFGAMATEKMKSMN